MLMVLPCHIFNLAKPVPFLTQPQRDLTFQLELNWGPFACQVKIHYAIVVSL